MLKHVQIKLLNESFYEQFGLPKQETSGSAGFDLLACLDTALVLEPNQVALVDTGIDCYIADPNYAGVLLPRSGLGHKHGIVLGNSIGLIDSDYQGPLKVSLLNRSNQSFTVEPGMRMAQLIFIPVASPVMTIVKTFDETERGAGGFGSTGINSGKQAKEVIDGA